MLDGEVYSNPQFQHVELLRDRSRSRGASAATEASDLAKLINYGALPVQLKQLTVGERVAEPRQGPARRRHRGRASSA